MAQRKSSNSKYNRSKKYKKQTPFRDTGRIVGKALGRFFGNPEGGAMIGGGLGSGVGSLFGSGDYSNFNKVQVNSLIKGGVSNSLSPTVISSTKNGDGSVTIRKREYIRDIVSSSSANTFENKTYDINPGDAQTFPWLSNVSHCFQTYRMNGLIFEFKSLSADSLNSTQTALGYVAMATQYDVLDADFSNKHHLENSMGSQSCKPSQSQLHGVECNKSVSVLDELYVRDGDVTVTGSDKRFYDMGKLNIATSAPGTNVILGELYATYDITLFKSKLPETNGGNLPSQLDTRSNTTGTSVNFGLIQTQTRGNVNHLASSTVLQWDDLPINETYQISLYWIASANITTKPSINLATGTLDNTWTGPTGQVDTTYNVTAGETGQVKHIWLATIIPDSTGRISLTTSGGVMSSGTMGFNALLTAIDSTV